MDVLSRVPCRKSHGYREAEIHGIPRCQLPEMCPFFIRLKLGSAPSSFKAFPDGHDTMFCVPVFPSHIFTHTALFSLHSLQRPHLSQRLSAPYLFLVRPQLSWFTDMTLLIWLWAKAFPSSSATSNQSPGVQWFKPSHQCCGLLSGLWNNSSSKKHMQEVFWFISWQWKAC